MTNLKWGFMEGTLGYNIGGVRGLGLMSIDGDLPEKSNERGGTS